MTTSTALIILLCGAVAVGALIGAVGIGGVLLIPLLLILSPLTVHEAAATALFSFLFTGIVGGFLFSRRGSLDWRTAMPVCVGALLLSFVGAALSNNISATMLTWIVAAILLGAGIYLLMPQKDRTSANETPRPRSRWLLLGIGSLSGFGAGLSGAGGPLFSVPLMLALRFDPLVAIGTGQVVQIAASLSGSLGNMTHGSIRYGIGFAVTAAELIGTVIGVRIAHAVSGAHLRKAAAVLCVVSAVAMGVKAL